MFALNVMVKPALGKIAELKSALTELTEYRRSAGDRSGLYETVWSSGGTQFGMTTLHESIAEAGEARARIYAEPQFLTFISRIMPLVSEQASWRLWDVIVQPPIPAPAKFVLRVGLQSAIGKNQDVRQIMTDWCKYSLDKGNAIALSEEVWGAKGGRFSVRIPQNSLAEAEASRAENAADPKYQQLASDLSQLIEGPASWELSESIITPLRQEATNGAQASAPITA